jgi:3-hydroxy-9,10-secoandrosta-1,3,5(10)-triene-9,17-dione monooxygenase reductase component
MAEASEVENGAAMAPIEPDEFRRVLGHFPTGVAVVTATTPEGPVGMACNSLASVSLEPPLICICPAKSSETWPKIRETGSFLVNLMHRHQSETAVGFARRGAERFSGVEYHVRTSGPALSDSLGWIECLLEAEHDAGDHTIALGRVIGLEARADVEPLVFFRGSYGTFAHHEQDQSERG